MIRTAHIRPAAVSLSLAVLALAATRAVLAQESASRALFDLEAARSVADEFPTVVPQGPTIPTMRASYDEPLPSADSRPREPISDQQLLQAGLELTDRFDEYASDSDDEFDGAEQDLAPDDSTSRSRNSLKGFLLGCIGCLGALLALKWLGGSLTSTSATTTDGTSPTDADEAVNPTTDTAPSASLPNHAAITSLASPPQASSPPPPAPRRRRRGRKRTSQAAPPPQPQVMSVHTGWPTQLTVASPFPIASPMPVPVPVAVPQPMAPIGYLPYPNQAPYPPQGYGPPPQSHHYQHANHVAPAPHEYSQPHAPQPAQHQPAQYQPVHNQRVYHQAAPNQAASYEMHAPPQPSAPQPHAPQPSATEQFAPHQSAPHQSAPRQPVVPQRVVPPQAVSFQVDLTTIEPPSGATSQPPAPTVISRPVREITSANRSTPNPSDNDNPENESAPPAVPSVDIASRAVATTPGEHPPRSVAESPPRRSGDLFARILEENRQVRVALDVAEL